MTDARTSAIFRDGTPLEPFIAKPSRLPPPRSLGPFAWARQNLFASVPHMLLTLLGGWLIFTVLGTLVEWALINAVWDAPNRRACMDQVGRTGACWPGVIAWAPNLIYGLYPKDQVWRINWAFLLLIIWAAPLWMPKVQSKIGIGLAIVLLFPFLASYFFIGGGRNAVWTLLVAIGATGLIWSVLTATSETLKGTPFLKLVARSLGARTAEAEVARGRVALAGIFVVGLLAILPLEFREVPTRLWGGLFLTLVISGFGIAFSLPAGILLALARRSKMPLISVMATTFIELFRSVPLITILFMFNTMLPLFLPAGVEVNQLLRAIVAVCLFTSAYMAEVVRGGLQGIPRGQYEAAASMGLGFWQSTALVIMPQALKIMIPSIVGNFIGLFKDTTLVSIIGLLDLLSMSRAVGEDTRWLGLFLEPFFFISMIYFIFCFAMSQYSLSLENRLGTGQRR